jgi:hypothetical protein
MFTLVTIYMYITHTGPSQPPINWLYWLSALQTSSPYYLSQYTTEAGLEDLARPCDGAARTYGGQAGGSGATV